MMCNYFASDPDTPEKKKNMIEVMREIEPSARRKEIRVGLESPQSAAELVNILNELNSDCFGVYYDVGNAIAYDYDPVEEIRILGKHIIGMHMKDTVEKLGDAHLGKGRLDLDGSIAAMREIGYNGYLMIETQPDKLVAGDIDVLKYYT